MRLISTLIMVILLSSCSAQTLQYSLKGMSKHIPIFEFVNLMSRSTLYFEVAEQNGWDIIQPPDGQWRNSDGYTVEGPGPERMSYLPEYFPESFFDSYGFNNFFYALYKLDNGEELALWIHILRVPVLGRRTWTDLWGNISTNANEWIATDECRRNTVREVMIMFNKSDVYFDSSKVNFVIRDRIIDNNEIINRTIDIHGSDVNFYSKINITHGDDKYGYYTYQSIGHNTYHLISPDNIDIEKRISLNYDNINLDKHSLYRYSSGRNNYSIFDYTLSISCFELEDSILMVDGLSYYGKPLPPLMVHINYYDYNISPEYVTSAHEIMELESTWVGLR